MSNNYDSVLKEKKKYVDYVDDRPFIRKHLFIINVFALSILLLISFGIYFLTILSPQNIFLNDLNYLNNKFYNLYKNLGINDINNLNLNGNIVLEVNSNYDNTDDINLIKKLTFDYSLLEKESNKYLSISNVDYPFSYLEKNNKAFLATSDMNVIYDTNAEKTKDITEISNSIDLTKQTFISDGKIVTNLSFEIDGNTINELLNSFSKKYIDILKLFNIDFDNSAKYEFTFKNDIFTNNIISIKIVKRSENNREVLVINDNTLTYSDDNDNNYKATLDIKSNDFTFKFYNQEKLKFVISGKGNDNSYVYNYQVINVVDNAAIQIKKEKNKTVYTINIKKEKEDKYLNILATINNDAISIDIDNLEFLNNEFVSYSKLDEDTKRKLDDYIFKYYNSFKNLFDYVNN